MSEETKWVSQEIVKPPQNPPLLVANQGSVPQSVPNANPNKNLPWFLWLLAGCGCLAPVIIIIFVIIIIAINPMGRFNDNDYSYYTEEINNTARAVNACIETEKANGTEIKKIYSSEMCANKDFLYDNRYSSKQTWSDLRVLPNLAKDKICAYITYYDSNSGGEVITSWDSTNGISEIGKGTKLCSDSKETKTTVATNSATTSAK